MAFLYQTGIAHPGTQIHQSVRFLSLPFFSSLKVDVLVHDLVWSRIILVDSEKTLNSGKTGSYTEGTLGKKRVNVLTSFGSITSFHVSYQLYLEVEPLIVTHTIRAVRWSKGISMLVPRGAALGMCFVAQRQMHRVSGWSNKVSPLVYRSFLCRRVWIKVHH